MKTRFNPAKDETPNGWLITPACNLALFVSEEMVLAGITERALTSYSTLPLLLTTARHAIEQKSIEADAAFDRLIEFTKEDADFAKSEVANGFKTIYSHHCAGVWAAIETNVEQIIKNMMLKLNSANELIARSSDKMAGKKLKFDTPKDVENSFRKWQNSIEISPVMSRYLHMLATLGIKVDLPPETISTLDELGALRNVIVHKSGFIDEKFLGKVQHTNYALDDLVTIDRENMSLYFDAASLFTKRFLEAVMDSDFLSIVHSETE